MEKKSLIFLALEKAANFKTTELLKGWKICPNFDFVKYFGFG